MPVPDFSPGEVLTAAAMDSIGMWLVKSQAVGTNVSSVPVTNCFSADYDNYKIIYAGGTGNTFQDISMILGSTTSGYYWTDTATSYVNGAVTGLGSNTTSNAYWRVGKLTTGGAVVNMDITCPFVAGVRPFFNSFGSFAISTGTAVSNGGYLDNGSSYTGFTLNPIGSTLTGGTIRVYGYRN
jgi:hypothetical protein